MEKEKKVDKEGENKYMNNEKIESRENKKNIYIWLNVKNFSPPKKFIKKTMKWVEEKRNWIELKKKKKKKKKVEGNEKEEERNTKGREKEREKRKEKESHRKTEKR